MAAQGLLEGPPSGALTETLAESSEDLEQEDFDDEDWAVDNAEEEEDDEIEGAAAGGACVGQDGWDTDFANRMYKCAVKNAGSAKGSGKCMAKKQGVSKSCGRCMGKFIHCSIECSRQCCRGKCMHKSECKHCSLSKCDPAFYSCAGVHTP